MKRSTLILPLLFLSALFFAGSLQVLPTLARAADEEVAAAASDDASGCQASKAAKEEMKAKMAERDARLDGLVAQMNAATGDAKTDAVAAVLTEMIAQRKEMRAHWHGKDGYKGKCCAKSGKCEGEACSKCEGDKKAGCAECAEGKSGGGECSEGKAEAEAL